MTHIYTPKRLWHIAGVLAMVSVVLFPYIGVQFYHVQHTKLENVLAYFICFWGFPMMLLILCWRRRPLRWYLLIGVVIVAFLAADRYYFMIEKVDNDVSNYLEAETLFNQAAEVFLPQKDGLSKATNIEYMNKHISLIH